MNVQELKTLKLKHLKSGYVVAKEAISEVLAEIEITEVRQNKILDELEIMSSIKKTVSMFEERARLAEEHNRNSDEFLNKAEYLKTLLPKQMSVSEIHDAVKEAITKVGGSSPSDMGKVMGYMKQTYGSSLDMRVTSEQVRKQLI